MSRDSARAKRNRLLIIIAVIIIIVVIIIYFVSLGKINLVPQEDEKTKRIRWIDNRLQDLHYEAKSKKELKEKLDGKVKKYFLYTRIALAILFLAANVCTFIWALDPAKDFNDKLSTLLNYNEAAIIFILIALFIRFETPSEFRDVFKLIHLSVINIVYKNHRELEIEIQAIHAEIEALTMEKDGLSKSEPPSPSDNSNPPQIES